MPGRTSKVKEQSLFMCLETRNDLQALPPAVIIHNLAQICMALAVARPVTLLSAPGAAAAWGGLWWRSLLEAASHAGPALLDCGESPGRAIEALMLGLHGVVLAPNPAWDEVAALAQQTRALLLPTAPVALDLGQKRNERQLVAWLDG